MPAPTKTQKLANLVKQVNKYVRNNTVPVPPKDRNVLDILMYAALFENTVFENADLALTKIQNYFIDWNEVRVCTVKELAYTIPMIPRPEEAARRIKKALQALFEKTYAFDMENLRKRGKSAADALKQLEEIKAGSPFMIEYTAQIALGTHLIPLDEAAFQLLRPLGLTQISKDETKELGAGLERAVAKPAGLNFSVKFHHLAALFYADPQMPERAAFLKAIDPESLKRSSEPPQLKKPYTPPSRYVKPKPVQVPAPTDLGEDEDAPIDGIGVFDDDNLNIKPTKTQGRKPDIKNKPKASADSVVHKPDYTAPPVIVPPIEIAPPVIAPSEMIAPPVKQLPAAAKTKTPAVRPSADKKPVTQPPAAKTPVKMPVKQQPVKKTTAIKPAAKPPVIKTPVKQPAKKAAAKHPVKPVKKVKNQSPSKDLRKKKPK
ncbi:MAG: hypothetical protein LBT46_02495 [Planctomycetaceae bacterium]|jgi:endonuclease-3|nr:hypothetical protein [Planctomycetaceae bacterium]